MALAQLASATMSSEAVVGLPAGGLPALPASMSEAIRRSLAPDFLPRDQDRSKEPDRSLDKLRLLGKVKDCCGYPLGTSRSYKMTFYWLAWESEYANEPYDVEIYTRDGFPIGRFPRTFVFELKMEGSGILRDGRIVNYDGACPYGIGVCFAQVDASEHPFGRGGQSRALQPFRSVAVDPRFIPLGTPLYIPELRGILLPDGSRHDGCVRADDTGGNIRRRELDLFVESYANWKFIEDNLWGDGHVTPLIEEPRCAYLRNFEPSVDRRNEISDWAALHPPLRQTPARHSHKPRSRKKG